MKTRFTLRTIETVLLAAILAMATAAYAENDAKKKQTWQGEAHDAWIDGKIETSYALNRHLNPFAIDTEVEKGAVRLTGAVESQIDKDLAGAIAEGIDGVTAVQNDLMVDPKAEKKQAMKEDETKFDFRQYVEDATTTAEVKFALLANDSTEGLAIDVDTENGKVSLAGSVGSKQESELAEQIARNTDGVSEVENHLQVSDAS